VAGRGDAASDARRNDQAETVDLADDYFWTQLECTYASAFGWSLAQIYEDLDLPTYFRHLEWWAENPPLHMLPRALAGAGDDVDADDAPRLPSRSRGARPRRERDEDGQRSNAGNAGGFLQAFLAGGGQMKQVPPDYFERRVAEIDAAAAPFLNRGSRYGSGGGKHAKLAASIWMAKLQDRTGAPGR
jgi:hypothetical protein